jgi:hypothetical protein
MTCTLQIWNVQHALKNLQTRTRSNCYIDRSRWILLSTQLRLDLQASTWGKKQKHLSFACVYLSARSVHACMQWFAKVRWVFDWWLSPSDLTVLPVSAAGLIDRQTKAVGHLLQREYILFLHQLHFCAQRPQLQLAQLLTIQHKAFISHRAFRLFFNLLPVAELHN